MVVAWGALLSKRGLFISPSPVGQHGHLGPDSITAADFFESMRHIVEIGAAVSDKKNFYLCGLFSQSVVSENRKP